MPQVRTRIRRPAPVSAALGQIGDRIRQARTDAGLSQAQLGTPHFTRAYVSAIELGKVRPAMKSLEFMAAKLGKPASHFLDDADAVRRRLENSAEIARAGQLISQGKAAEAIDVIGSLLQRVTTPSERAALQRSLGRALTQARRAPEAVAVLNDALRFFKVKEDVTEIARTRSQLGSALIEMRSYAEGQQELESALAYMSKSDVKDPLLKVHTLYNLGISFFMRGDYGAAGQQFDRAAREGADIGDLRWQAGLYAGMGMSYSKLGDFEAAVSYLRKSEALFEAINNKFRAVEARLRAAQSLKSLGQRAKAGELLSSALAEARASGSNALAIEIASHQSVLWAEEGRTGEAETSAVQARDDAVQEKDPLLLLTTQMNLAQVLRRTDPTRAADILREAAAGASHAHGLTYSELYSELSEILAEHGLAEEALKYSRLAYKAERNK